MSSNSPAADDPLSFSFQLLPSSSGPPERRGMAKRTAKKRKQ